MEEPLTGYLTGERIDALARLLAGGRVVVLPTDTIYGFHCLYSDEAAVDRIVSLKGRSGSPGFILLASSTGMADDVAGGWPGRSRILAERSAGRPLTLLLPASGELPAAMRPGGKVAVRIPALGMLRDLIERVGAPLVSTSANRSGRRPLTRIGEIRREFPGLAAYISKRGRCKARPSTIIDMTGGEPVVVREGAVAPGEIFGKAGEPDENG